MSKHLSGSEAETRAIASRLAAQLAAGTVILLTGDLGTGKTAFVKGLAEGLGVSAYDVTSPTFTLVHEYRGGRLPLVHIDLYRLEKADMEDIGVDEDLVSTGVTALEWAERLSRPVGEAIRVEIRDTGGDSREITIRAPGPEA